MNSDEQESIDFESEIKFIRKKPYLEINISDIPKNGNYRLIGTIESINGNELVVNDGSGQITVFLQNQPDFEIKEGSLVRIFGFIELEPKKQMNASIIQDMSKLDIDTYFQVKELENSLKK